MLHDYRERALIVLVLFVTLFYSWKSFAKQKTTPIRIEEINHHHGGRRPTVEVGTCMFYCNELPHITLEKSLLDEDTEKHTFTIHNAVLANEKAIRKAQDVSKISTEPYTLSIQHIDNSHQKNVVVSITHPKGMCTVQHKPWEQKDRNKCGLIFYIYDQSIINTLRKKNEPMLRTVSLNKPSPRIFIDSGHGGTDTGAVGFSNIQEKDVCLCVSKHLVTMLYDAGYDVIVSRMTDCDVPLDERTSRANNCGADLFVSIHANASLQPAAHGIETFCLAPLTFTNFSEKNSFIDKYHIMNLENSKRLAHLVQKNICQEASCMQKDLSDRGIKYMVSHILVGSNMPSILVEIGFVTNPKEAQLLSSYEYQHSLARGITHGIQAYVNIL